RRPLRPCSVVNPASTEAETIPRFGAGAAGTLAPALALSCAATSCCQGSVALAAAACQLAMRAALVVLADSTPRLYWARWKSVGLAGSVGSRTCARGVGPAGAFETSTSESCGSAEGTNT